MFGDYYTTNLLSASPRTSMIANLIDEALTSPFVARAASLVIMLMLILLLPILYYLHASRGSAMERG
jgi:spermidine/putrescine transport system permease protein